MSYLQTKEYQIIITDSYRVVRNCGKCGCKTEYHNTNRFRVNANGNSLDVWLIYQCSKCKHTYNLTVYERVRPNRIPRKEYEGFLSNDYELAFAYGTNKEFFRKNKAVIKVCK